MLGATSLGVLQGFLQILSRIIAFAMAIRHTVPASKQESYGDKLIVVGVSWLEYTIGSDIDSSCPQLSRTIPYNEFQAFV